MLFSVILPKIGTIMAITATK